MRITGITLLLILLAGCSDLAGDAETAVREQMLDSESAQFRNVRIVPHEQGDIVCGEVNGKNRFGGYVGFTDFVAIELDDGEIAPMMIDEDAPYTARSLHERFCE